MKQRFNVSSTWTPDAYSELVSRIQAINDLPDINKVPAGAKLLVPQVPETGKRLVSGTTPNPSPAVKFGIRPKSYAWAASDTFFTGTLSKLQTPRVAPQQELQFFRIPEAEAGKYLPSATEVHAGADGKTGFSGTIDASFAQGAGIHSGVTPVLLPPAAKSIYERLQSATADGPRPILVVLDDSFPDSEEFKKAIKFVLTASSAIRSNLKLGESPYTERLKELEQLPNPLFASPLDTIYPAMGTHAALVKHSLSEFVALDGANRIELSPIEWTGKSFNYAAICSSFL